MSSPFRENDVRYELRTNGLFGGIVMIEIAVVVLYQMSVAILMSMTLLTCYYVICESLGVEPI